MTETRLQPLPLRPYPTPPASQHGGGRSASYAQVRDLYGLQGRTVTGGSPQPPTAVLSSGGHRADVLGMPPASASPSFLFSAGPLTVVCKRCGWTLSVNRPRGVM